MAAVLIFRIRRYLLVMLLLLVAVVTSRAQAPEFGYWDPTPLPQQGLATFYNPGIMEYVRDYRTTAGDIDACPECVGAVALLRAGDIGRRVWLQPPGGDPVGPFLVVDCARRQDVQPLLDRNWVVDVSYEVGQYWGMNRPLDGVIVFEDPADTIPGKVTNRIPTPFAVSPGEVIISPPTSTPEIGPLSGAAPTTWPTRQPMPLVAQSPGQQAAVAQPTPTAVLPTPTAVWPPPLTPIITTPTRLATPEQRTPAPEEVQGAAGRSGDLGVPELGPTIEAVPTEVALARAGEELVAGLPVLPSTTETPGTAEEGTLRIAPTARPTLARTPRPNLTPILPVSFTPAPTPAFDSGLWDLILRGLIDLVR